ncbi:ROK family protein [Microbacterium sp. 179-I 3D4 NHS]|uniref:ROK family protein n=1 Tax=Microbacterium sp. 179-I 3D4 NHS TaxID=3142381 RepID=UPI00399F080A
MTAVLGIDYGGTRTKLLLARRAGEEWEVVRQDSVATASGSVVAIVDEVRSFVGADPVAAFGITVPGVLDEATGTVVRSTNLPWLDATRPADDVRAAFPTLGPGVAVQDGSAAALAEATLGAGHGHRDVFVVTLGTGVAGAHLIDGGIRAGAHGAAGEIGHVATGGVLRCSCGGVGCLETFIGGRNLGMRWDAVVGTGGPSGAREVVEAADAGDGRAAAMLDEATGMLAQGLLGLVATVDPGVIVLGGGVAQAHERIVAPTVAKVAAGATFHAVPPILPARLGAWAGAWGAVLRSGGLDGP